MDTWRQWIRHRTADVNEYSTRYSVAINSTQKTEPNEWRLQAKSNKQGSNGLVDGTTGQILSDVESEFHNKAREVYDRRIELGVAREQARKDLPLSTYTEASWGISLHNLFHFLKLRLDPHAQYEIRQYAKALFTLARQVAPLACAAFEVYNLNSVTFSQKEMNIIMGLKNHVHALAICDADNNTVDEIINSGSSKMTKREITEFKKKLGVIYD